MGSLLRGGAWLLGLLSLPFLISIAGAQQPISRVAFGSCLKQDRPQPIWSAIIAAKPDAFLFVGDNVYADTTDAAVMSQAYQQLAMQPGYQRLKGLCPIHATWDDHDYGENDAGADYPMQARSERIFRDFFEVPIDAPMRSRPGVYAAHTYGPPDRRVQIILLDTRSFRSPLKRGTRTAECPKGQYAPNDDPAATVLGAAQWSWLERQLSEPAALRIIVSSIQVIPEQHCFEKWGNFPYERARLFQLIARTGATGVVLLSGDRHLGEISQFDAPEVGYPVYEITSSGMNSAGPGVGEQNRFRVTADNIRRDNFGLIQVDWSSPNPVIQLQLRSSGGDLLAEQPLRLGALRPAHAAPLNSIESAAIRPPDRASEPTLADEPQRGR